MLRRRNGGGRLLAAASSAVVLIAGVPASAVQPSTSSDSSTTVSHGGAHSALPGVKRVTLITGDVVTIRDGGRYAIERGPGRAGVSFAAYRTGGHLHVVPSDAFALLKADRLDSRLFDVTALVKFGYDDRKADLPLIVAGPSARGGSAAKVTAPADAGLTITKDLKAVKGSAAKAEKKRIATLWKGLTGADKRAAAAPLGTAKVWLDGVRQTTLDVSVPLIGAPTAWQAGYTGAGVKVAVLDTGIDDTHPDLAGKVIAKQNFAADFPDEDDLDRVGHGTHVASTIAGSGAASGGRYKGVAPDAKLLNGKVCVQYGCDESWILAGMQWAAEQGADVVNMSLGGGDTPDVDPVEQAVNDLTAQYGVLFVVAAGNEGDFGDSTVGSPASADAALAVAATSKQDELASFSSRGPRVGDGAVKPDIAAPGVEITAARSSTGFLGEPGQPYMTLDGTSMATPHVAGSAAILAQEHPSWTPAQLKATLTAAAKPLDGIGGFAVGSGRVDVARAIGQTVTTDKAVSFGRTVWPHGDDTPITKSVTFSNSGSSAVTLNLAVKAVGPGGAAVPSGLFALGAPTVTVPAGGTASVSFTADTRVAGPDGLYSGQLVGTSGDVSVSTAFGIEKEVESYDVTVNHTERDGDASESHLSILTNFNFQSYAFFDGASQTIRVPKGDYVFNSWIDEADPAFSMLFQPKLTVDHTMTIDADARVAKEVKVTVADPQAQPLFLSLDATVNNDSGSVAFLGGTDGIVPAYSARLDGQTPFPGLTGDVGIFAGVNGPDGTVRNSPKLYQGAWFYPGTFPTGAQKAMNQQTSARVDMVLHQRRADTTALPFVVAYPADDPLAGGFGSAVETTLPFHRTLYLSTDPAVRFQTEFDEFDADGNQIGVQLDKSRIYQPGTSQTQHFNNAVYGPSFAAADLPWQFVTRWRDILLLEPPLFGDGTGHAGFSEYTSAKSTLWRNGKVFATDTTPWLDAEVPPQAADYKYTVEIQRAGSLSTKVTSTWTFRSKHVAESDDPLTAYERLPVQTVSFAPAVDDFNRVAAGQIAIVPITVSAQPGAKALKSLTVESSINDGKAWKPAAVFNVAGSWYALVQQKSGATVSLRAHGVDTAGKTAVDLTVIRAYQVK